MNTRTHACTATTLTQTTIYVLHERLKPKEKKPPDTYMENHISLTAIPFLLRILFFFLFHSLIRSFVGISEQFRAGFYHNGSVVFSVKWWTMHCALVVQCWWDYRVCLPYHCVLYLCAFDKRSDRIDSTNDVYLCSFIVFTITPIGTTNQLLFCYFFCDPFLCIHSFRLHSSNRNDYNDTMDQW